MGDVVRLSVSFKNASSERRPIWLPRYQLVKSGLAGPNPVYWSGDFYTKSGFSLLEERTAATSGMFALVAPPDGWFFAPYSKDPEDFELQSSFVLTNLKHSLRTEFYFRNRVAPDDPLQPAIDWRELSDFERACEITCSHTLRVVAYRRFALTGKVQIPGRGYLYGEADSWTEDHSVLDSMDYFCNRGQVQITTEIGDSLTNRLAFMQMLLSGKIILDPDVAEKITIFVEAYRKADISPDPHKFAFRVLGEIESGIQMKAMVAADRILAQLIKDYRDPFLYWDVAAGEATEKLLGPATAAFRDKLGMALREPIAIENIGHFVPA